MKTKRSLLCVLVCVLALATPLMADTISPHTDVSATGDIIDSINNFNGQTLLPYTDLELGVTTRYTASGGLHDNAWGNDGADDFDVSTLTHRLPGDSDRGDDALAYIETIFGGGGSNSYDKFFIFEWNGNEVGTIQAIYESGALGEAIAFSGSSDFGYTGVDAAYLAVFEIDSPATGIRINCAGFDAQSISATVIPIPGAVWLLGTGLIGLVAIRRRLRN
jgi:hypothetical protein